MIRSMTNNAPTVKLTMRVLPAAVLGRKDERTGCGDGSHISFCEERYGGPGGHAEQGSWCIRLPVAGRNGSAGGVAKGAGRHGDRLTRRILLRVTLGWNLLIDQPACTKSLLRVVLRWRGTGCHAWWRDVRGAARRSGGHGPRWRQVDGNVANVDGQSNDSIRGF